MEEEKDIQTTETETVNSGNVEATAETNTEATGKNAEGQGERTYTQKEVDEMMRGKLTQEQVNEIIEKRLARAKVSANSNDGEEVVKVREELQSLQLKLAQYEKQVALAKYRIDEKYQDYVDYKVLHMTSKDKDYATALEEFFKDEDNKKYLQGETLARPIPRPKNSNSMQNEKASDNNLRAMFGLGDKK